MDIDKSQIVEHLKKLGKHDQAAKAESDLPEKVNTEEHAGLLQRFGIDPKDLLGGLGGMFKG
jgi:hypothetical protein